MVRNYKHLVGSNASIDISLLEYGMAWFDDPESDEIEFFYGIRMDESNNYVEFDNGWFKRDVDPKKEWNWVDDWGGVASYAGLSVAEFLKLDLTRLVQDLVAYYGYMNVFGETHWGAWFWNENLQRFQMDNPEHVREELNRKRAENAKKNWIHL